MAEKSANTTAPMTESRGDTEHPKPWRRFVPWIAGIVGILLMLGLQTQLYSGQERTVIAIFMFVALAQSWNLIGGFTGYPSFGQVVFFGIGGYFTAVIMVHLKVSFWLALPLSGIVAAVFGILIGLPLLRLKGHYFAIATLAVAEGMREVVTNIPKVTGGGAGITVPGVGSDAPTQYPGNDGFYLIFLFLAVFCILVCTLVAKNKFGFSLRAINQDEDAAAAMGVNTTRAKVLAFGLSGLLAGLVGSAYAFQQLALYPQRLFDVDITVLMIVMVIIGGSGTIMGPIIGAVVLQFLSEWLRHNFTDYHTFILGGIIVVAVIFLPQGFVNYLKEARAGGGYSLLDNVRRYRL